MSLRVRQLNMTNGQLLTVLKIEILSKSTQIITIKLGEMYNPNQPVKIGSVGTRFVIEAGEGAGDFLT